MFRFSVSVAFKACLGRFTKIAATCVVLLLLVPSVFAQDAEKDSSDGFFGTAISAAQPRMVKVFGAGAGTVEGFATGVVVSDSGHILTMQGVFLDGKQVRVVTIDGKEHQATIMRRDRVSQLAMLKIEAETPDFFELSKEAVGEKGDWIVAISNAFKVADKTEPMSAMIGIVSLRTTMEARLSERDVAFKGDLVVIDSITSNPGAGGGAVVLPDGRLVGMIGKIINSSETNTRLNYCVPSSTLAKFVSGESDKEQMAAAKVPVEKAELGIKLFKLGGRNNPAYVDRVSRGTPAHKAGIKTDDMVVSLGGEKIATVKDYQRVLDTVRPNEETIIIVKRGLELLRIPITPVVRK